MGAWNAIVSSLALIDVSWWLFGVALMVTAGIWIIRRRKEGPSGLDDDTLAGVVTDTPTQIMARFDGLTDIQTTERNGLYSGKQTSYEGVVSNASLHDDGTVSVFLAASTRTRDAYVSVEYPKKWKAEASGLRVGDRIVIVGRITQVNPPILSIEATQPPKLK